MLTKLRRGGLKGNQRPRVSWLPEGPRDYSAGEDALDLADIAGRESMDWQQYVVREGMAANPDSGKWIAFEVAVLVARQNGKNGGIEVVELGWMVNEPGVSILHTAHEFQTALEAMDKLEALIRSHPLLENEISTVRHGNGKEAILLRNGSIIRFRTRTKSGGRGFSVDRLVIDEAMIWSPASQAAIMPLLTTAQRPQIWYLGSAADAETHEYCGKWASLRRRALTGDDPGLIWLEWSAPEPPENEAARAEWREDRQNWALANPSVGELLTEEYIESEMRAFRRDLDKWEVERLSAGRWPVEIGDEHVFDEELWQKMANLLPELMGPRAIALDRAPDRRTWAIAGSQWTKSGDIHLEIGYSRSASATEIVEYLVRVVTDWNPVALVIDQRSPAAVLKPYLLEVGIEPVMTNTTELALACEGFLEAATAKQLSHSDQVVLNDAVLSAVKRELPGGAFAWDKAPGGSVTQLMAATLAHWALLTFGTAPKPKPAKPVSGVRGGKTEQFDAMTTAF